MSRSRENSKHAYYPPYRKNLIINGCMRLWQRGLSFTGPSGEYTADRWFFRLTGTGVVNVLQSTVVPTETVGHSLHVDVTTAIASPATNDNYAVRQYVEGYNIQEANYGTTNAKTISVSFWVRSTKIGTYCVSIRNSIFDRVYVVEYEIDVTDTWEFKEFTITGDTNTSSLWEETNLTGFILDWVLHAGSDRYAPTTNTWGSVGLATSNQVNFMDSTANNFYLKDVQVEISEYVTPFEYRSMADETNMCQRYYEKSYRLQDPPGTVILVGAKRIKQIATDDNCYGMTQAFRTTKRTKATIVWYSSNNGVAARLYNLDQLPSAGNETVTSTTNEGENHTGYANTSANVTALDRLEAHWTADAELS